MRTFCHINYYRKLLKNSNVRRFCSNTKDKTAIENIRNIGILAHIDAGKTTTTERMLFYSGTIGSMGEVHHGNTVTDYMEQERQRGITITSAAVSFPWNNCQINLIDTPGHIDFTMEVEQSLAVLDGAVVVLDASAGVEAQTLTVWHQAAGYRLPRLLYLNKMDRQDADVGLCVDSVREKLEATPLLLHLPVLHDGKLVGLIDLVTKEEVIWTQGRGRNYIRNKLTERDGHKFETSSEHHRQLIDTLSSMDDELADTIIQQESLDNIDKDKIHSAIWRCTVESKAFPVVCGSSYKNIGVQTLMDAVVGYLPSPLQCNELYKCFESDLAARAFKVQHDDQRGVLTFLRVYSGEISKGQKIYNLAQEKSEQTGALYAALADEYRLVNSVTAGHVAVVSSLKSTMSGDLVTASPAAASRAKTRLTSRLQRGGQLQRLMLPSGASRLAAMDAEPTPQELADVLLGVGTEVPEPVFLCSIEPPSALSQVALEAALQQLAREDPSLRVSADEESGQIILAGMGELHLEIIKERIVREYKIDVELGPLSIAYKESLVGSGRHTLVVDRKIGNQRQFLKVTLSAKTVKGVPADKVLRFDKTAESAANLAALHPRSLAAVSSGVRAALLHGPTLGAPMMDVQVTLHWFEVGRGTSESVISASVVQCLRKVFEEAGGMLLEPVMRVQVAAPPALLPRLLADLARRRADVHHVDTRNQHKVISCVAPLSELLGYSSAVRMLSSGLASFSMQFHAHRQMSPQQQQLAVRSVTGF